MKRFTVNCRNHRGRTSDVEITAASEAEAIGYLRKKGFTDCVVRGATRAKVPDDATKAVPILPDPDAPVEARAARAKAQSFSHGSRRDRAKDIGSPAHRATDPSVASAPAATGESERGADRQTEDEPWWATSRGIWRHAVMWTQTISGRAWAFTRAAFAKGVDGLMSVLRRVLARGRKDEQELR